MQRKQKMFSRGFTLIEVLVALTIVSIALLALLHGISQNIINNQKVKDKIISHWVAMQGVEMIQLGLLTVNTAREITQVTEILGQKWYWRVKVKDSFVPGIKSLVITTSKKQIGPFRDPLQAFYQES